MRVELPEGGVIRQCPVFAAGARVGSHHHQVGHLSILLRGRVRYEWIDGLTVTTEEYTAPAHVWVPAFRPHDFIALDDDTEVWCVFFGEDR